MSPLSAKIWYLFFLQLKNCLGAQMASDASAFRLGELSRKNPVTQQWRPIAVFLDSSGDVHTRSGSEISESKADYRMYVHNLRGVSGVRRIDDNNFALRSGQGNEYVFRSPDASACDGWIAALLETGWMLDATRSTPAPLLPTSALAAIDATGPDDGPLEPTYVPAAATSANDDDVRVHVSRHGSVDISLGTLDGLSALVAPPPGMDLRDSAETWTSSSSMAAATATSKPPHNPFNAEFDAALADTSTWMDSFLTQTATTTTTTAAAAASLQPTAAATPDNPSGTPQVNDILPNHLWDTAILSRDPRDFSMGEYVGCVRIDGSRRYALVADVNLEEGTVNLLVEDDAVEGPMFHYNDPIDPKYIRKIPTDNPTDLSPTAPSENSNRSMDDDDVAGEEELAAQNVSMLSYASIHNEERFDDDDMDGGGGGDAAHNDSRESAAEVRAHTFVSFSFSSKFSHHLTFPSLSLSHTFLN